MYGASGIDFRAVSLELRNVSLELRDGSFSLLQKEEGLDKPHVVWPKLTLHLFDWDKSSKVHPPLQHRLFAPEIQWQSRGQRRTLQACI